MPISHGHQQPGGFEEKTARSGEGGMEQKWNCAAFKDSNLIVVVRGYYDCYTARTHSSGDGIGRISCRV